ncbi:hypothetical protein ACTQ31_08675 [Clostridium butyricum]|uniref:hypothetical protein n=1 Tax=Clostridium butyricum TaxID=1492 RepID=UPI003F8E5C59
MFLILVLILISIGLLLKKENIVREKYTQQSGISYNNALKIKVCMESILSLENLKK